MKLDLNTSNTNVITYIRTALCLFFLLTVLFYFVYRYPLAFNFETDNNGQYYVAFFAIFLFTLYWAILSSGQTFTKGDYLNCFIVIIFFSTLIWSEYFSISNEYYVTIMVIFITYYIFRLKSSLVFSVVIYFLAAIFIWQSCISVSQFNGFTSEINPLSIKGTLRNSGIFSCYLVAQLPFLFYLLFQKNHFIDNRDKNIASINDYEIENITQTPGRVRLGKLMIAVKRIAFFCIVLFTVFIIYKTKSRTAFLSIIITLLTVLWFYFHANTSKSKISLHLSRGKKSQIIISISVILILCMALYLFQIKKLSALGRVLKWEITMEHIGDHFWLGEGLGRFTWRYPQWQATYFELHTLPKQEYLLSAGESYILFNEYLQLFKSVGLLGFVLFLVCLYYFFKSKSSKYKNSLNATKATVIAILSCGFTSYPLHVTSFLFLLAFCFAYAANVRDNSLSFERPLYLSRIKKSCFFISLLVLSCYATIISLKGAIAKYKWDMLRENTSITRAEAKNNFLALYSVLKHDGKFLTEYGEYLSLSSADCGDAVKVFEKAKIYFLSRKTVESTAYAYWQIKNYSKAEENFKWLSNFLPNHFGPKYELFKIYLEIGDYQKAKQTADIILKMPVKIPSETVEQIKKEVYAWSKNYEITK
jgi:tetratricopeptide (TPR) repeat protein